jgi:cytoskeleton protein RodZ
MSDEAGALAPAIGTSAGRLLREAREKQGLHIAALAAAIKVPTKKLEMLESDRFDALPDATFTRALAQTVCRALKTDPAPVLRLLPPPQGHRLESVGEGLNTPFRERPGMVAQSSWPDALSSPGYWLAGLLLVAATVVFFLPAGLIGSSSGTARPASSAAGATSVEPGMPPAVVGDGTRAADAAAPAASAGLEAAAQVQAGSSAPASTAAEASAPAAVAAETAPPSATALPGAAEQLPPGVIQLRAASPSWVEVSDARGQPLISRLLQAGEAVGLEGAPPFRVRIGNAAQTELVFRGQPTDLKAFTRDNVARLELR